MHTASIVRCACVVAAFLTSPTFAEIYRCALSNGRVEYQSTRCETPGSEHVVVCRNASVRIPEFDARDASAMNVKTNPNVDEERTRWERQTKASELVLATVRNQPAASMTKPDSACTNIAWATSVRAYVLQTAVLEDTRGGAVYTIKADSWANIRHHLRQYIRAATDADRCISGNYQHLQFYSPDGQPLPSTNDM